MSFMFFPWGIWQRAGKYAAALCLGLSVASHPAGAMDPLTKAKLLDIALAITQTSFERLTNAQAERERLSALTRLTSQITQLGGSMTDIESVIRSERIRSQYVDAKSLNGRVGALGREYGQRISTLAIPGPSQDEFLGRLRQLRAEAQKLAHDASPILDVSDDNGIQFLLSVHSILISTGVLESIERQTGSRTQAAAVYESVRNEFSVLVRALERRLADEERLARAGEAATREELVMLSQAPISQPLAVAIRNGQTTISHCVESRQSTFERQTEVDVCIGSQASPVRIGPRTNRETGEVMPARLTYGCVRYVREDRRYELRPIYRNGVLIGGTVELRDRRIRHYSTSDSAVCPIQRENFEPEKDWAEVETIWRQGLNRIYAAGGDVALSRARRTLIEAIARLNAVLKS